MLSTSSTLNIYSLSDALPAAVTIILLAASAALVIGGILLITLADRAA